MILCDYGCGKEAKYQFKNGKWCCSKSTNSCPKLKKLNSIRMSGRNNPMFNKKAWNKDLKGVQKAWNKGLKGVQKAWNKGLTNIYSKKTLKKMSNARKKIIPWNKNIKLSISKIKNRYPTFAKIEEMRYEPDKPDEKVIQVHCKNHLCSNSKEQGGWFTPINRDQLFNRIWAVENDDGNRYYYCSEKCKQECPLFGKTVNQIIKQDQIAVGHLDDPWYTSKEYQEWRQHILELDDNKCVYCEELATIAHHILPQKTHPNLSLDSENGLSVCKNCHYKYGHRDSWCTTGKLSTLVCERIIRIKNKHVKI